MCESCSVQNSKPRNPLLADPTRTTQLRRKFEQLLRGKFARIKKKIRKLLIDDNAFDLKKKPLPKGVTDNIKFTFETTSEQVRAFEDWLEEQIDSGILGGRNAKTSRDGYWAAFSEDGYRRGAGRAFEDVRKPAATADEDFDFFEGTKSEFLRQSFARPVAVDKLKILAGRTFKDLRNVTEAMATQLSRQLTDGLARGENPRKLAKELTDTVDKIGARRAETIARSEIIRAHAEGQLDALEMMGVEEVGVMVEWSTAGDERVCPLCQPLEGVVLKIREARGLIPRHPNCRCSFIPANVGEPNNDKTRVNFTNPKTGESETKQIQQKRSPLEIKEAQRKSLQAEIPKASKRTIAQQKERSAWAGAIRKITKKRPPNILAPKEEKTKKETREDRAFLGKEDVTDFLDDFDKGEVVPPRNLGGEPGLSTFTVGSVKGKDGSPKIVVFDVIAEEKGVGAFTEAIKRLKEGNASIQMKNVQTERFKKGLERLGFKRLGKNDMIWDPTKTTKKLPTRLPTLVGKHGNNRTMISLTPAGMGGPGSESPEVKALGKRVKEQADQDEKIREAITDYTDLGFGDINRRLQKGEKLTEKQQQHKDNLLGLVEEFEKPVTVYRGSSQGTAWLKLAEEMEVSGKGTLKNLGFSSTSLDPETAGDFSVSAQSNVVVQITAKRGAYLEPVTDVSTEMEMLLPPDSEFRVLGIDKNVNTDATPDKKWTVLRLEQI